MGVLTVPSDEVWGEVPVDGFDVVDGEWRLDLDRFAGYLEAATGISPDPSLSAADCYRIGNRLEALLEEAVTQGHWHRADPSAYPAVESWETVVWLARFFRRCHECTVPGALDEPGETPSGRR